MAEQEEMKEAKAVIVKPKLAKASTHYMQIDPGQYSVSWPYYKTKDGPWSPSDVDKLEFTNHKVWNKVVEECRYYYKRDPFVSTVINKIIDISINDILIQPGEARKSIIPIIDAIKTPLLLFLRSMALEYLISGLVVPEITFSEIDKEELHRLGIKRFDTLTLPTDMWVRDSATVVVKDPLIGGKKSYFMKIPPEMKYFIDSGGKYSSGGKDEELYNEIVRTMPELVAAIKEGEDEILLENPLVLQYRTLSNDAYPTPYLYPALESLKHKRNLKRMDYSIAARVIGAIQLIKMGDKDYPLTEDNEDQLTELKKEMKWRENQSLKNVERVFQLFGNHTLTIEWVMPDVNALLDQNKYQAANQDIAIALGFPRILVTGETERTQTSDPEIATVSPLNTMERLREIILPIINTIIDKIVNDNNLGGMPEIKFKPINLMSMSNFVTGVTQLYADGNLSREDYAAAFGFDIYEQFEKQEKNEEVRKEAGLPEFAPVPHSNQPGQQTGQPIGQPTGEND